MQEHRDGAIRDGVAFYVKVSLFNVYDPQGVLHRAKHWQWTIAFNDEKQRCQRTLREIAGYFDWRGPTGMMIPAALERMCQDVDKLTVSERDYHQLDVSSREFGSILAGLRLLEATDDPPGGIDEIANGLGEYAPLTDEEIDSLCVRLNTD